MKRIVEGLLKFQREIFPAHQDLFEELAEGQNPRALFITCGDSRVVPTLMTQTRPGELFLCRNAGNIVPPHTDISGGITATIEYAVEQLQVPNIIVCGHSDCGAMKAVLAPETIGHLPKVKKWLAHADAAREVVRRNYGTLPWREQVEIVTKENIVRQLENLRTHPSVAARLESEEIHLFGWYYDIRTAAVEAYDARLHEFVPLDAGAGIPEATPPRRILRRVVA